MDSQYRSIEMESRILRLLLEPPLDSRVLPGVVAGAALALAGLVSLLAGGGVLLEMVLLLLIPAVGSAVAMVWLVPGLRAPTAWMVSLYTVVEVGLLAALGQLLGNRLAGFGFGVAFSFGLLHSSLVMLGGRVPPRSLPGALPALGLPLAVLLAVRPAEAMLLIPRVLAAVGLLLGVAWALMLWVSRRMQRRLKFSMANLVRFYSRVLQGHAADIRPLIPGVAVEAWVDTLAFRVPDPKGGGGRIKALWVSTSIHPGLMRNIGAYDLPREATQALRGTAPVVFFKGASTHEQDPLSNVTESVVDAVRRSLETMTFTPEGGDPVWAHQEDAVAVAQVIGPSVFLLNTFAPHPTDDLDLRVHEEIQRAAGELGAPRLFYVEAHNSHGDDAMVLPGSPRARRLAMASRVAVKGALVEPRRRLRMGMATRPWGSLLLLEPHPGGKRSLLALFDENNILPEARQKVIEVLSIPGLVPSDAIEVCTSDNHRNIDPLRVHSPMDLPAVTRLRGSLRDMLAQAEQDLEEVEAGYARETLHLEVYGKRIMEMKAFWENHRARGRWVFLSSVLLAHLGALLLLLR